jgi:uridylate kinase
MKIVISLGGSVMVPDGIDKEYVKKFSDLAKEIGKKHSIAIVTGGGKTARKYIEPARTFGASEFYCDLIGIDATRMNARILSAAIGEAASKEPAKNQIEAANQLDLKKIVVMGGTEPGHSTDAVAALLAEYIKADLFINASNVDGIFDSDPAKNRSAKMFEKIKVAELIDLVKPSSLGAGKYELVDLMAAKIIQRSKMKAIFLNGKKLDNLKNAIDGKKFVGTSIGF